MIKIIISVLHIIFFWPAGLHAQEVITTAGGDASGSGGSISFSVGQVVYTTNTGSNGSGAQGVQQPYEISVVQGIANSNILKIAKINKSDPSSSMATGNENSKLINLECMAFPNPTNDLLTLSIQNFDTENGNLSYRLLDIDGRLLESKIVENRNTNISMGNRIPASYILNIFKGIKSIKTFKIIKK